jgi:spore coat protein H
MGSATCLESGRGFGPCECEATTTSPAQNAGATAGMSGSQMNGQAGAGHSGAGAAAGGGGGTGVPPLASGAGGADQPGGAGVMAPDPGMGSGGKAAQVDPSVEFVTSPSDEAAYLFDQSQVRTYNIVVAPADLAAIDSQPSAEAWVPAQLEFEGQSYGPFKVRYKGSSGSFKAPCTTGDYDAPKSGKCSVKLGFDEVDEAQRFYGLKKLNFHAMTHDPSQLRDRLGYSMFRESNVVAPRAVHAKLLINGVLEGLFVAVEQIDGRFTRARFGEGGEGNVYKQIWMGEHGADEFVATLETNSDVHDVTGILEFQTAVKTSAAATEQFIDRAYMARYLAVDRVIVNDDGPMHFYCDPNTPGYAVGNGNYYWYQSAQTRHFWLIPWDLDLAFDGTPWVNIEPAWTAQAACTCVMPAMYSPQMPPSCDALVKHFLAWRDDYEREVDNFIKGPFSDARVQEKLNAWVEQIKPFVMEAAGVRSAPTATDWQSAVQELRAKITSQRAHRGLAY